MMGAHLNDDDNKKKKLKILQPFYDNFWNTSFSLSLFLPHSLSPYAKFTLMIE